MIFRKINRKIALKKSLDKTFMLSFFQKRKYKFLVRGEQIKDLNIVINRNFLGKFRNVTLRYTLFLNKGEKVLRGRIHKFQDIPEREWKTLNWLQKCGLGKNLIKPVDYFKPLNIFFYEEAPGVCGEKILAEHKIVPLLKTAPELGRVLRKIHSLKYKKNFLPVKNNEEDLKERKHWYFLMKKCCSEAYADFSRLLKLLWRFKMENGKLFNRPLSIIHEDLHWGNVIIQSKGGFKIIDYGYACYADPMEDVGGFLAQNKTMFDYHVPKSKDTQKKIEKIFLENYFQRKMTPAEELAIAYFRARKHLEIAAVLSFVIGDKKTKMLAVKKHLAIAERAIKFLYS